LYRCAETCGFCLIPKRRGRTFCNSLWSCLSVSRVCGGNITFRGLSHLCPRADMASYRKLYLSCCGYAVWRRRDVSSTRRVYRAGGAWAWLLALATMVFVTRGRCGAVLLKVAGRGLRARGGGDSRCRTGVNTGGARGFGIAYYTPLHTPQLLPFRLYPIAAGGGRRVRCRPAITAFSLPAWQHWWRVLLSETNAGGRRSSWRHVAGEYAGSTSVLHVAFGLCVGCTATP